MEKFVHENGDIEFEYYDVSDDELFELVANYPKLLDESDDINDRYTRLIQFDTNISNDIAFYEVTMC